MFYLEEKDTWKLAFLNTCKERKEVIGKATKAVGSVKYPTPMTKLRQDREIEAIIKEIKSKPKIKRKPSVPSKPAPTTSSVPSMAKGKVQHTTAPSKPTKTQENKPSVKDSQASGMKPETLSKKLTENNSKLTGNKSNKSGKTEEAANKALTTGKKEPPKVIKDALGSPSDDFNKV